MFLVSFPILSGSAMPPKSKRARQSLEAAQGEIQRDVEERIARASKAFGALCKPVFHDGDLSLKTKRLVYRAHTHTHTHTHTHSILSSPQM